MLKTISLLLIGLVFLAGCSVAPSVDGRTYLDPLRPTLKISFPYPVEYVSKKVHHSEIDRVVTHQLLSPEKDHQVFVQRSEITLRSHVYTESESSRVSDPYYLETFKSGFCSVNLAQEGMNNFLLGTIMRYVSGKRINKITTYQFVGQGFFDDTTEEHRAKIGDEISNTKYLCSQFFK